MIDIPKYKLNHSILELLGQIENKRGELLALKIPLKLADKIRRISLLKISVYSARIEGNRLHFEQIKHASLVNPKEREKIEIANICFALKFFSQEIKVGYKINLQTIKKAHSLTLKGLDNKAGYFRPSPEAIFNQAGIAVYLAPPPQQIETLMTKLLDYIDKSKDPSLITAFIAHLFFEKIHPFIDGSGRVGRLLITIVLLSKNYSFNGVISFEEFLEENRENYYYYLDIGLKETESYLSFMLNSFLKQLEKTIEEVKNEMKKDKETMFLSLRREEILNIIKDHKIVSLDFIRRRFLKIPVRTLRNDLQYLCGKEFIIKRGSTRGAVYAVKEDL